MEGLSAGQRRSLERVLALLAADSRAPSTVTDPDRAWRVHVADSLSGLEFVELAGSARIADLGSGAGFPGLVLAVALPAAHLDLIEASSRKCEFLAAAIDAGEIANARVVCQRAEIWAAGEGREAYEAVTARAVGRLATIAELAAPLLAPAGALVAWKGRRDAREERELERAAARLAMAPAEIRWVGPYAGSHSRHLHLVRKSGSTPDHLPRRPGLAKKRPFGAEPR